MNPTLRGFLVIGVIALVVVVLQLEATLVALSMLLRIAFFLAIAFFVFLVWRERRDDIDTWSGRAKTVFYSAALLILVDVGAWIVHGLKSGLDALAFILVLGLGGFAMWRVWRDEHTYAR
jgi:ABC-type nickel/cobalt efflux system permease component RcnA